MDRRKVLTGGDTLYFDLALYRWTCGCL